MEAAAAERLKKTEDEQREKEKQRLADESKSNRLAEEQEQENQRLAEEQERARIAKASSDVARRLNLFSSSLQTIRNQVLIRQAEKLKLEMLVRYGSCS